MNKKILVVIGAVVALGGVYYMTMDKSTTDMTHGSNQQKSTNQEGSTDKVIETNEVEYKDFEVAPSHIRIKKGTTVTWTNQDAAKHDVTPDKEYDGFNGSDLFGKGESFSYKFDKIGTYSYHCSPHPYMKGTVEVVE